MKSAFVSCLAAFFALATVSTMPACADSVSSNSTALASPNSTTTTSPTSTTAASSTSTTTTSPTSTTTASLTSSTTTSSISTSTTSSTSTTTTSSTSTTTASPTSMNSTAPTAPAGGAPPKPLSILSMTNNCVDLKFEAPSNLTATCSGNGVVEQKWLDLNNCLVNHLGTVSQHGNNLGGGFVDSCGVCDLSGVSNATLTCPCYAGDDIKKWLVSRVDLTDYHYFQYNTTSRALYCDYLDPNIY
ncbi:hypothetical protein F4821DRAFT_255541 [Hypoxylon rubiginosum]|uniref:Uncharacterized protein n=1 Tax=Hypoxylon rubiginosum TaxID=110542 RepID=A0ACC0DDR1_9PEZI|nr:hypothetical protein F4821DRAFT_255541 [Hypoxylon rubiginosum]